MTHYLYKTFEFRVALKLFANSELQQKYSEPGHYSEQLNGLHYMSLFFSDVSVISML